MDATKIFGPVAIWLVMTCKSRRCKEVPGGKGNDAFSTRHLSGEHKARLTRRYNWIAIQADPGRLEKRPAQRY